ncbi:MAG: hypothetical protein LBH01_08865 [Verrucomicrobiales bacterium]|jgi:triacylglycerol lipase|nr:hypothetical protein [Verrucomicrobiales bacterium]
MVAAKNPVVLVHGFKDSGKKMSPMANWLHERGWETHTPTLTPSWGQVGIDILAQQLANYVDSTLGLDAKFDLIGFSMGGLATRYYLQNLGGYRRVDRYISIAAPHHGTAMAYLWPLAGAKQMRPGSGFLRDLDANREVLNQLKVTSIWTPLDLMIVPATSSRLAFAREYKIPLPAHPLMVYSEKVFHIIEQELEK